MRTALHGAGLGLRRGLLADIESLSPGQVDFLEVAPENWINIGGRWGRGFRSLAERYPISLHGLSLNLGGFTPLDHSLLQAIRQFSEAYHCPLYSEHLSYCGDHGHLYDLMPLPFTEEAVQHVAGRICEVQDVLGRRIAIENVSYYAAPYQAMTEIDFLKAVLAEADCDLLLDVNNIHVNSINHGYDAMAFLQQLPLHRAVAMHVAGHYVEAEDLRIDTHGAAVIDPVWHLLQAAFELAGPLPTLLERDFNFPPMAKLLDEVQTIRQLQARITGQESMHA